MDILKKTTTNQGVTLTALSKEGKVLVVFLWHFGCTFCREALQNISKNINHFHTTNTTLVFVYPYEDEAAAQLFFSRYNLQNEHRIDNADGSLYEAFDLHKGTLMQLLGPQVWWSFLKGLFTKGVGIGAVEGDYTRLGGAFYCINNRSYNRLKPGYQRSKLIIPRWRLAKYNRKSAFC